MIANLNLHVYIHMHNYAWLCSPRPYFLQAYLEMSLSAGFSLLFCLLSLSLGQPPSPPGPPRPIITSLVGSYCNYDHYDDIVIVIDINIVLIIVMQTNSEMS